MARSFGELDAEADYGVEGSVAQVLPDLLGHRLHEIVPACIKRDQRACPDVMACLSGQQVQGFHLHSNAVKRKETWFHRDNRFGTDLQSVKGQQADAGGTVDNNVIIILPYFFHGRRQPVLLSGRRRKLFRQRREQDIGRSEVQVLPYADNNVAQSRRVLLARQNVIDCFL